MAFMLRSLLLISALLVAGCGYSPPGRTDTQAPGYKADLAACEAATPSAVNARNAKTGLAWFASPVTRWSQIGEGMNACMADKGWGRVRACTAEELRQGNRPGPLPSSLVVTARGVQCADPARPS